MPVGFSWPNAGGPVLVVNVRNLRLRDDDPTKVEMRIYSLLDQLDLWDTSENYEVEVQVIE